MSTGEWFCSCARKGHCHPASQRFNQSFGGWQRMELLIPLPGLIYSILGGDCIGAAFIFPGISSLTCAFKDQEGLGPISLSQQPQSSCAPSTFSFVVWGLMVLPCSLSGGEKALWSAFSLACCTGVDSDSKQSFSQHRVQAL